MIRLVQLSRNPLDPAIGKAGTPLLDTPERINCLASSRFLWA
jgi:hypothetical protein